MQERVCAQKFWCICVKHVARASGAFCIVHTRSFCREGGKVCKAKGLLREELRNPVFYLYF